VTHPRIGVSRRAALALPALALSTRAGAQEFPSKVVTFVVPLTAGGPADSTARVVADKLSEQTGRQFIVENVGGAAGMQALIRVSRAPPDGHTLLVGPGSFVTTGPMMAAGPPFDAVGNFEPVTMISRYPSALFISTNVPATNLEEFVAYARKKPGGLTFASPGAGTGPHIGCEIIKRRFGFEATHVPYRGGAPELAAVASGECDFALFEPSNLKVQLQTGRIRVLALADQKRNWVLPDVPTFAELGYPEIQVDSWTAAFAPKGTPPALLARLNALFRAAMDTPEVKARFMALQIEMFVTTPEELRRVQVNDIATRRPLMEALDLIGKG
jgi:tripartite-type tricarboxylate transporter receptor subunit TctC